MQPKNNKNFQSVTADLGGLAATMPTQMPITAGNKPRAVVPSEPQVQFSLNMRRSLRRELNQIAVDNDLTMRTLVLDALRRTWGLKVTDDDLLDERKVRPK